MTAEERALTLLQAHKGSIIVHHASEVTALAEAIRDAENEALERAAREVEAGFALVPRSASWNDKRELLADRVRSLKTEATP